MVVVLVVLTFAAVFAKKAAAENIVLDHGGLGLTMADGKPEEKKNEK